MFEWIVLVCIFLGRLEAAQCPYTHFFGYRIIRVADEFCTTSIECYINSECNAVNNTEARAITAVGNMKNYKDTSLVITGSNIKLFGLFLPPMITQVNFNGFDGLDLTSVKEGAWDNVKTLIIRLGSTRMNNHINWPPMLQTLTIYMDTNMKNIPQNLPPTLQSLSLQYASISDLVYLPENNLTRLDLSFNSLNEVTHKDWRNLTTLTLDNNPLTTFAFVQLSSALQCFTCLACNLSNITINSATFEALNSLKEWDGYSVNKTGFRIEKNVTTNANQCSNMGGVIRPLFQSHTNLSITACVLENSPALANSSSSYQTTIIVVVGIVILMALLIVLFIYRRKSKQPKEMVKDANLDLSGIRSYRLELSDLNVTSEIPLAVGGFGEVWLGTYNSQQVVVKRLKSRDPRQVQMFINEICLWAKLESDYIVKFIGASWTRPIDMECVLEYMDLGDLRTYLSKHSQDEFSWDQKYDCIRSIVNGLIFLHTCSPPIIHRDLKSRNVLLDNVKGTKLTDFGTSKMMEDEDKTMTMSIGTYRWMAPEVLTGTKYSIAADIYSFGIVLSEFCTHDLPFGTMSNHQVFHDVSNGGACPSFGENAPEWVKEIAMQCLKLNADDRPTALKLFVLLRQHKPL